MKYYLIICFCFPPFLPVASDWQKLSIGVEVVISLPAGVDTSGIQNWYDFSLNLDKGRIIVNRHSIEIPLNKIGEFGIESYAMDRLTVPEENFDVVNKKGLNISGIPAYTYQFIDNICQLNTVIHLYYKGHRYSFQYQEQGNNSDNEERDKFFLSIYIKNQWKGNWEIYNDSENYQFLLSLSDTAAISDYYCLQNCFRYSSDYYEHQSKKCFVNNPFNGFYCIEKVNGDSIWLEQFKNRETKLPKSYYGLRVNHLQPRHFNYDATLVQIELPHANETREFLIAGKRFSNILIGPSKDKPAQVRIQVNDVLIEKPHLNLFLQQELDKLAQGTKQLNIHLHADQSLSEQDLIHLFKNTQLDQHRIYRIHYDSDNQRVGIKRLKFPE